MKTRSHIFSKFSFSNLRSIKGGYVIFWLVWFLLMVQSAVAAPNVYFVKNGGNDGEDGLSDATAWRTLTHAVQQLASGDTLLLERGSVWTGDAEGGSPDGLIYILDKNNITIDAYGSGAKPGIDRRSETYTGNNHRAPDYTCVEIQGSSRDILVKNLQLLGGNDTAAGLTSGFPGGGLGE
jgi:hypothetical protein